MARAPNRQLVLDLGAAPRYERDDFLAASSNQAALDLVERWPNWPDRVLVVSGAAGSGKSHLAAIWSDLSGAPIRSALDVNETAIDDLRSARALVIEDADRAPRDETALFHVLDTARQTGCFLLLTSRVKPTGWMINIPDLLSRLRLAPAVTIGDPDETLLRAVLVKLLADRQIVVDPGLLDYAARNLGRSLADARSFVDLADRHSLAASRRITRAIAADVLAGLAANRDETD